MLASGRENRTSLGWLRSSTTGEFPGGPVVRTPCFHCREHRFNPWSGNYNPANCDVWPKKNRRNSITFSRPKCSAPQQWRGCVDRMSWGGKLGRALMGILGWGSLEWWEEECWLLPEGRDVVLRSLPWWWWFIWGWGGGWTDRLWASSESCWNASINRRDPARWAGDGQTHLKITRSRTLRIWWGGVKSFFVIQWCLGVLCDTFCVYNGGHIIYLSKPGVYNTRN